MELEYFLGACMLGPALMIVPSLLALFGWDSILAGSSFSNGELLKYFFIGAGIAFGGILFGLFGLSERLLTIHVDLSTLNPIREDLHSIEHEIEKLRYQLPGS